MDRSRRTRPWPRVPVRLSLPAFDPGNDAGLVTPRVMSDRLDRWLAQHLMTTFGLPKAVATTLVTGGWILPVLDGLDEMDRDDVEPQRAASVIRAVNQFAAGDLRPVVVTCRSNRYQQLSGHIRPAGEAPPTGPTARETISSEERRKVVQDATVVGVEPLTTKSTVDYLTSRFPDPVDRRRVESRWRPIADRLTASNSGDDPLAAALSSPLRLFHRHCLP